MDTSAQMFRMPFINQFCTKSRLADWQQELDLHRQGPTDSVEKYATRLQELMRRVDPERELPERNRISQFKRGLKPDIQFFITPARPRTLEDAIDTAKQYETAYKQRAMQPMEGLLGYDTPKNEVSELKNVITNLQKQIQGLAAAKQREPVPKPAGNQRMYNERPPIRCYNCNQLGHISANCVAPLRSWDPQQYRRQERGNEWQDNS